jgi:ubiquinone/menaquinone biosynthesis C-methylase UbiE
VDHQWLFRTGFDAIGIDISRAYLEIAAERLGRSRPHLVVADIENLPLADGVADSSSGSSRSTTFRIGGARCTALRAC